MHSLGEEPVALGLACAGAVAWVVLALTRHIRPSSFEIAALCYLVTAPLWVSLPYKQYYAPWFVLSAVFVPFLGVALHLAGASLARTALAGILVFASVSGGRAARDYGRVDQVAFFRTLWTLTRNAASPEGRVVADPQWHPIYRGDVFYGWFSTYDPRGRGQEVILREWNPRGYGARFTDEGYAREIAAHPPALIVTVGGGFNLPATQENVVARYVRDHGAEYVAVPLAGKLGLLVRRDQANWDYLEAASLARRDEARAGVAASGTTAYHDDFARGTPAAPVGAERDPMRER
jgi:hypothetical protein